MREVQIDRAAPWDELEAIRSAAAERILPEQRQHLGQVFTPVPVARLLAESFADWSGAVDLVDGGAGAGTLGATAALCALASPDRPRSVRVTAWEVDAAMIPYAKRSLALVSDHFESVGVPFEFELRNEDFIRAAARSTGVSTHAILNPPYAKLRASASEREDAERLGAPVPNLYAAFMLAATAMLSEGGEMVAITPRSFCNGPYFKRFRQAMLDRSALRAVRVFESRMSAFADQSVLQENVITHFVRSSAEAQTVRVQVGDPGEPVAERVVPFGEVVFADDQDAVIHLAESQQAADAAALMHELPCSLSELGVKVSTGPVVDFRNSDWLRPKCADGDVPLLYPSAISPRGVSWPSSRGRKPHAIANVDATARVLTPTGAYVLVKRFSSKEERRRVVAAALLPDDLPGFDKVGIENHLNYIHSSGRPLPRELAIGLAAYLNLDLVDTYLRIFSGHTQVNASDLRRLRFPERATLEQIGSRIDPEAACRRWIDVFRLHRAVAV